MATSNFHNVNASHIFAVQLEDEWEYQDLVSNLESEFNTNLDYSDYSKSDPNELRSFPSKAVGSVSNSIEVGEDEVEVYVTPVIRSGYYEGVNLDWHVRYYVNGSEDETYESHPNIQTLVGVYVNFIENVYEQYSQPLGVTARFSNGETIYHQINLN